MIIVLGQSQAFPEAFAAWLTIRGHVVCIEADEPDSFIVEGNGDIEELFDEYSDGEYFHRDESEW